MIRKIRLIFDDIPIIINILIIILFLLFIFFLIDGIASKPESFYGYVIDKNYKSESNTSGIGYLMTNTGKGGVILTSEYESEKFILIVKNEKGNIVSVECEPEIYYEKQVGQKIYCKAYKGRFTGLTYSMCVII
jgi:hypothetical protein